MCSCEGRSPGPRKKESRPLLSQGNRNARGPVSRVLYSRRSESGDHSSNPALARGVKQPTRAASRNKPICRPYSVLHPVGFTVPPLSPKTRCALAAPFRPYPSEAGRYAFCGTIPQPLGDWPGVTRHRCSVEPGLSSPGTSPRRGRPALWLDRYKENCVIFRVGGEFPTLKSAAARTCSSISGSGS